MLPVWTIRRWLANYLEDFNALEETYLTGNVVVLLCGLCYCVSVTSPRIDSGAVTFLEVIMVACVALLACISLSSVFAELFRSIQPNLKVRLDSESSTSSWFPRAIVSLQGLGSY